MNIFKANVPMSPPLANNTNPFPGSSNRICGLIGLLVNRDSTSGTCSTIFIPPSARRIDPIALFSGLRIRPTCLACPYSVHSVTFVLDVEQAIDPRAQGVRKGKCFSCFWLLCG